MLRSDKPTLNGDVAEIALTLAMHTAASKPSLTKKEEVTQKMIDQVVEDGLSAAVASGKIKDDMNEKAKEKALEGIKAKAIQ